MPPDSPRTNHSAGFTTRQSPIATIHGHGRIADRSWAEPDLPQRRQPDNLASHVADAPSR
ncbi:MAG: hypothetical protein NTV57_10525 [Cyanobacteria bacterium]|nr:hypothetical protein [Cyanobacteriota bacterium]